MLFTVIEENVDVVELCVNVSSPVIDCPIDFPFEVRLSTLGQTASKPHPQKCHNFNSIHLSSFLIKFSADIMYMND